MPVASNNYVPLILAGNGAQTVFSFTWEILQNVDQSAPLAVWTWTPATSTLTPLVQGVDYTVPATAYNTPTGGSITLTVAPATGTSVIITRTVPNTQTLDLGNQGSYNPASVTAELDLIILLTQQLQYLISTCLQLPVTVLPANFSQLLPTNIAASANQFLAVNPAGNGWILTVLPNPAGLKNVNTPTIGGPDGSGFYHASLQDDVCMCDPAGLGSFRIYLPPVATAKGKTLTFLCISTSGHTCTIYPSDAASISGHASISMNTQWQEFVLVCDGLNWYEV